MPVAADGQNPTKPQAPSRQATPQDAAPPTDHLILDGIKLPCYVKVAVYQSGMAVGLGIKTTNPILMKALFRNEEKQKTIRELIRKQVNEEVSRHEISFGVKEEEIASAIIGFVDRVLNGEDPMSTRKIAEGQPPKPGEDGWLEYPLNPGGLPLRDLGKSAQLAANKRVFKVREGDVLVAQHPPTTGENGCSIRGEAVEPARKPKEVKLESVAGANTVVAADKLTAAIAGVYREDQRGQVSVVQEVPVEEVNASTGDLPKTGVASTNFSVRKGVRAGSGIYTTEDVFIGRVGETGALDRDTRLRARNLFVRGQVAGGQMPAEYLKGELEGLEESKKWKVQHQLERSQIEVEQLFGAREVLGRNIAAGKILIQAHGFMSALDASEDLMVDGNLIGGMVSFGRLLQVCGNLGDAKGTPTRIRLTQQTRAVQKKERFDSEIGGAKAKLEEASQRLAAHQEGMDRQAKKSAYWAALLQGEKRAPKSPIESRILVKYFQAAKEKSRLEQEMSDCKRQVEDLEQLSKDLQDDAGEQGAALQVLVGGTLFPGVIVELTHPLDAADLDQRVCRKTGGRARLEHPTGLKDVKAELSKDVNDYLAPRQEAVEERKQALDEMFKGREQRPQAPTIPDRRFETELVFLEAEGEAGAPGDPKGKKLSAQGLMYVHSRNPQGFFIKRVWETVAPENNAILTIEREGNSCTVRSVPNPAKLTPWQRDTGLLDTLDSIRILGESAKDLLLAPVKGKKLAKK